jgi:2,4-dienoyl-CoA reductase-like NADH-dependent reductase (Old Yellow Enzyme family)
MHPAQTSIASDETVSAWRDVLAPVRALPVRTVMLLQMAHAGLQTTELAAGGPPLAPSAFRSSYFRSRAQAMTNEEILETIADFAAAAARAKDAGFDGVQLHAAHGYLLHQFLSPAVNRRTDVWGVDRFSFVEKVVTAIRQRCGMAFPIFAKVSAPDGMNGGVDVALASQYVRRMEGLGLEAVEVSCGTMEHALNIFRGELPVKLVFRHNPFFRSKPTWVQKWIEAFALPFIRRKFIPFEENYNVSAAATIKAITSIPVIVVGGLRRYSEMEALVKSGTVDAVALCRPLIREPDLFTRFLEGRSVASTCNQCNRCAIMCDSTKSLRCYRFERENDEP